MSRGWHTSRSGRRFRGHGGGGGFGGFGSYGRSGSRVPVEPDALDVGLGCLWAGGLLFVAVALIHFALGIEPSGPSMILILGGCLLYMWWKESQKPSALNDPPALTSAPNDPPALKSAKSRYGLSPSSTRLRAPTAETRQPDVPRPQQSVRTDLASCDVCGARVAAARLRAHKTRVHWCSDGDQADPGTTIAKAAGGPGTPSIGASHPVRPDLAPCDVCGALVFVTRVAEHNARVH